MARKAKMAAQAVTGSSETVPVVDIRKPHTLILHYMQHQSVDVRICCIATRNMLLILAFVAVSAQIETTTWQMPEVDTRETSNPLLMP
jgi:hypothetical protein